MIHIKTAYSLLKLFHPEFVEVDGAVFLADELKHDGKPSLTPDKTATESFINHIHILDHFRHGAGLDGNNPEEAYYDSGHPDFKRGCEIAKQIAQIWLRKLMAEYPDYRFRVYYTAHDDPIVRFHRVREGEANWLDESDWQDDVSQWKVVVYDTTSVVPA